MSAADTNVVKQVEESRRLSVIGLGFIGLPSAALFAQGGWKVTGTDISPHVVDSINRGKSHLIEPGLPELVSRVVGSGMLKASVEIVPAPVYLITVPIPLDRNGKLDLSGLENTFGELAGLLKRGDLILLETTSPPGTCERVAAVLAEKRPDLRFPGSGNKPADVSIAHCPERVIPGDILGELIRNARIIGGMSAACTEKALEFYRSIVNGDCLSTTARIAELVKLVENNYRDVQIAYANELSMLCDEFQVDVWEVIRLANYHPRVKVLQPGPGVGGPCVPTCSKMLIDAFPEHTQLSKLARSINDAKMDFIVNKIVAASCGEKNIACLGLTFKPDVPDLRESPPLTIVQKLAQRKTGEIFVVDPMFTTLPEGILPSGVRLVNLEEGLRHTEIVVLLVDHQLFKAVSAEMLAGKTVIDTRGIWKTGKTSATNVSLKKAA